MYIRMVTEYKVGDKGGTQEERESRTKSKDTSWRLAHGRVLRKSLDRLCLHLHLSSCL